MRALIVDSFAGGGGASTGIEMALGRSPDIAINHSPDALAMHEVNHPDTLHLSKNIWHVDPIEAVGHRRVGLAWFSPDCKHFSKAKGGRPVKRSIRDLAWVVVFWARRARPEVIILENVEEFRDWGPVSIDGKPDPARRGETFSIWVGQLRRLGYRVQFRELRACDYGAPTIRKRFFMIARRDGRPIVWPKRTHGDPKKPADAKLIAAGRLKPYRTAAEIIDWSLPCPSIFDTSEEIMSKYGVRAVRPLADATMRRIARGVARYVLEAEKPFVIRTDMASAAGRNGVNSTEDPLRTQTTAGSHAVVVPSFSKVEHDDDQDDQSGNRGQAAALEDELEHSINLHGGSWESFPENHGGDGISGRPVIVPSFVGCGGRAGQSAPRGGDEPLGTQTAKADGCVVAAHLVETAHGEVSPNGVKRWGSGIKPIDEPTGTGTISGNHAVAAIHLTSYYGDGDGGKVRSSDPASPLPTDTAGGNRHAVVAAFLAQHNNDSRRIGGVNPGRPADDPLATLTASGAQQQVVAAHLMRQFGTSVGHGLEVPTHTDTAMVNKSALISAFLTKYYGQGDGASVDESLHTDTTKDRFGLVTVDIDGATYAIADIGMRMLTPRERFRAQGFPDSYIIDRRPDGSPITQTVQGSCCGNSVCPPLAAALVSANCAHLAEEVAVEAAE